MTHNGNRSRRSGQGLVEFALILPILLLLAMAVFDFGRVLVAYSSASNALRNAARYAEVYGQPSESGPRPYVQCDRMRSEAQQVTFASGVEVYFAYNPSNLTDTSINPSGYSDPSECNSANDSLSTGDILRINSVTHIQFITPLLSSAVPDFRLELHAQRTILKQLNLAGTTGGTGSSSGSTGSGSTGGSTGSGSTGSGSTGSGSTGSGSTGSGSTGSGSTGSGSTGSGSGTGTGGTANLRLQHRSDNNSQIKAVLNIWNDGTESVNLNEINVRYYFTEDSPPANRFSFFCDYATIGCGNVSGQVVKMAQPVAGMADHYLQLSFNSYTLAAGAQTNEIQMRVQKHNGNFTQANDYSYSASHSAFTDWDRITLHQRGSIIWGIAPGGAGTGTGGNPPAPVVSLSPGSATVEEGSSTALTFSLSAPSTTDITVQYAFAGSASSSDYSPSATPATITIPAGETSVKLALAIIDDTEQETDETVIVTLDRVMTSNANIHFANNTAMITIPANDAMPTVSISPSTAMVEEGSSIPLTISLSGAATSNVTVQYTISGTASPSDYSPPGTTGSVMIPMGMMSAVVNLSITDDGEPEENETLIVTLTSVPSLNATISPTNKSATILIPANDQPPSVTVSANPTSVTEGGTIRFTATLSEAQSHPVSVAYNADGGTATSGADYVATSGTFTFNPGEVSKYVDVVTIDDTLVEGNETFNFTLSSPNGVVLGTPASVSVTIIDNDIPYVTLSTGQTSVNEGDTTQFTVQLSQPSAQQVQVNYAFTGNATFGSDYTIAPALSSSGTITFSPGETSKQYTVTIVDDAESEGPETLTVTLSNAANAVLGSIISGQFTIAASDPPTVSISSPGNVNEGTNAIFDVTLSQASTQSVTVYWTLSPEGTTTPGVDYKDNPSTGQLTFQPGTVKQTISVPVFQDGDDTQGESFIIMLSNPTNATLGVAKGQAIIVDVPDATGAYIVTLSVESTDIPEPETQANVRLTVNLNRPNTTGGNITVAITAVPGTTGTPAIKDGNNRDFDALYSKNVVIPNGQQSGYINLVVYGDNRHEASPKTIDVKMDNLQIPHPGSGVVQGQRITLNLINNDSPPIVSLPPTLAIPHNSSNIELVLQMIGQTEVPVTIPVTATSGSLTGRGTAAPNGSFSISLRCDGVLKPNSDQQQCRTVFVGSSHQQSGTPNRYFNIQLGQPSNGGAAILGDNTSTDVMICTPGASPCTYIAP